MEYPTVAELGVAGVLLLVLFWVLKFATTTRMVRKGVAAAMDPVTVEHIKEIYSMTVKTEQQKAAGQFKCLWKDRDEIRDLMDILSDLAKATRENTAELRKHNNGVR